MKKQIIDEVEKKLANNIEKLNVNLNQNASCSNAVNNKKMSYAQIAKQNANKVVIKPKNNVNKNNRETKNALKAVIEPTEGLISDVKEINKGGIVVECANDKALETVQKKISEEMGASYEIEKVKEQLKKRVIKLTGLTTKLSEERVIECLKKQNEIENCKALRVIKIVDDKYKREESYNVLVETDSDTFDSLIAKKRVKIEYDSCRVFEHFNILRCFKCLGFNHRANECINKIACSKCGDMHEAKDCKSELIRCVNCYDLVKKKLIDVDVSHYAFSVNCPAYQKLCQKKQQTRK